MLRKFLRSLMEGHEKDITNSQLANELSVSDATISNFFNYKNDLTFTSWILAIRYLAPEKEDVIINEIADEMITSENRLNCRLLMEYASTKRNFNLLTKLIDSQKNAPKENKDWSDVYALSMHFQKADIPDEKIMELLNEYKPKYFETKIFKSILTARVMYRMRYYKSMFDIAKSIEKEVEAIKNGYIRENYIARLCELYAHSYLYTKGDSKKARHYANIVINSKLLCPIFTSHMYHLLGTSFLFDDYETSVNYFNEYRQTLLNQGRCEPAKEVLELDIFFAKVLWGQSPSENESNDSLEKMHYYARIGNEAEVEKLYETVAAEDPFALCYLGIAKNNPELLIRSTAKFIEAGNKFFAELPRKALKSFPAYIVSANVICSMNIA
jgi:hypothetical protein